MENAVELAAVTKRYGAVVAVDRLTLRIKSGEVFALLGSNGAGKTTTLELIEGLRVPDRGMVRVLGKEMTGRDRAVLRRRLGVQLQHTVLLPDLNVAETVQYFGALYGVKPAAAAAALTAVDLLGLVRRRVGSLSGGQSQRLAIALALLNDPDLLILDEPSTGLDAESRESLWDFLAKWRRPGKTILLTTHYLEEAERLAQRAALMHNGQLLAVDTLDGLINALPYRHTGHIQNGGRHREGLVREFPRIRWTTAGSDISFAASDLDWLPAALERISTLEGGRPPLFSVRSAGLTEVFRERVGRVGKVAEEVRPVKSPSARQQSMDRVPD